MNLPLAWSTIFTCPVCQQPYCLPKILPCLHSFCDACLRRELPSSSFTLVCPVCQQQSILPPAGISSLQNNPFVTEFSRLYPEDAAQHSRDAQEQENMPVGMDTFYCSSHAGQSLRFFCDDCDSAICSSCTDIEHREHQTGRLENAAVRSANILHQIVSLSESQSLSIQSAFQAPLLNERSHIQILSDIEDGFEKLSQVLNWRQPPLASPQAGPKGRSGKELADYAAKTDRLTAIADITRRVLDGGNPLHVILLKKQLDARADLFQPHASKLLPRFGVLTDTEVQDGFTVEVSGPLVDPTQHIVPNRPYRICIAIRNSDGLPADYSDAAMPSPKIHALGPLRVEASPTASPLGITSKQKPRLTSNSQNSLSTHSDHSGVRSTPSPTRRISCPLHQWSVSGGSGGSGGVSPSSRTSTPQFGGAVKQRKSSVLLALHVRHRGDQQFETAVTFPETGRYEVHITLHEQHVGGSPLKVDVNRLLTSRKSLDCKFMRTDTCRNSTSSRRSVSAGSAKQSAPPSSPVKVPPIDDDLICRIGCRGRAKGEFTNPQDICCTTTGRMVATDSNNQCVQSFTLQGEPRIRFGERGRTVGQLQRPTGIAAHPDTGQYVVADYENRWVSLFEPTGKFVTRFGMGKLFGPKGVAVDGEGKIYVVDNKASCICVFQRNGRLVGRFGSRGCAEDHLAGPHFIAINSFGHSVVSDFHNHAVKVFDTTGQFLYSFGSNGEGNGQFNAPTGIAVDSFDNILVADWGNSRIQVFDRHGSFLQSINSENDPLYGPQGLTMTPNGHVLVADSGNHCLKLFKYNNWVTSVSEVD